MLLDGTISSLSIAISMSLSRPDVDSPAGLSSSLLASSPFLSPLTSSSCESAYPTQPPLENGGCYKAAGRDEHDAYHQLQPHDQTGHGPHIPPKPADNRYNNRRRCEGTRLCPRLVRQDAFHAPSMAKGRRILSASTSAADKRSSVFADTLQYDISACPVTPQRHDREAHSREQSENSAGGGIQREQRLSLRMHPLRTTVALPPNGSGFSTGIASR